MFNQVFLVASLCLGATALQINTNGPKRFAGQSLTQVTDPTEMAQVGYTPESLLSQKSYPCIFKLGNAFFDFTPFKLA
jgi:hypothetical protein